MKYIYVCGPTVYSDVHIGNMRPILTFDIFNRSLSKLDKEYFFIHNITDIDDKIITKAKEENVDELSLANKYTDLYLELLDKANVIKPSAIPKVTDNIELIVNYIQKLIDKGNAYEIDGSVYFSVESVKDYGSLSNRSLDELHYLEGENKKHPADFALWKNTTEGIKFESPWSEGRPGWHTECAAFISKYANGDLDIHGGGIDLLFPHHENENAQNIALYGKPIAKDWFHVGHINLGEKKMSKSLGNIISAKDFDKEYSFDVLRYIFLTTSPSAPINLSEDLLSQSVKQVNKIKKSYLNALLTSSKVNKDIKTEAELIMEWNFAGFAKRFHQELKLINSGIENTKFVELSKLIGFSFTKVEISKEDKILYQEWNKARNNKDFAKADQLRESLISRELM